MAYFNTTIKDLISEKNREEYFFTCYSERIRLESAQVEKLFDSIMCGYPISSFLFWKIREKRRKIGLHMNL